jgi:DNA-binding beta-propeller fold protein YncE
MKHRMLSRIWIGYVIFALTGMTQAQQVAAFAVQPSTIRDGGNVKISFTVSTATDVEVAILDASGKVVRHLAAGLLGANAPAPFQKDSLKQELTWDGKDDLSSPVPQGPCRVRVRLGLRAGLERFIPSAPDPLSPPTAIGVGANGDVYVLSSRYMTGGVSIFVLDRQGKYLRTIMPSPANLKAGQVKGLERLKLPGDKEVPIIYGGYTSDTGPFLSGFRSQRLEVTSQGWIIMASGANDMWDQTVPRHVLVIKPDGTTPPEVGFVGPKLGPASRYGIGVREQQLAASPDGNTLYFAGMGMALKTPVGVHCIGKFGWQDKGPVLFIGKPDEPGADGEHLNLPETVSTDSKGNLLVADFGNNRVAVFSPEGKFLGETKVDRPKYVCVHPGTGAMYVMTAPVVVKGNRPEPFAVIKFDKAMDGREIARLEQKGLDPVLALDPGAAPARLWLANNSLCPIDDRGDKLELGGNVIKPVENGFVSPLYMCADPARDRLYVADFRFNILAVDLKTGKISPFLKASEAAVDRDGNVYVLDGYNSNTISRYAPDGKPLPFATGSNKLSIKFRNGLPNVGVKGLTVAPNGDIYAYQDNNTAAPTHIWQFGPDGKVKREDFVTGIPFDSGTGLAADHAGNLYAGINIHAPGAFYPADFSNQIPPLAWYTPYDASRGWYNTPQRKLPVDPPWSRPYLNFYLYQYGSIFQFGPEGGRLFSGPLSKTGEGVRMEGVPADAREFRNAYLSQVVWLAGAKWEYRGFGICAARTEGWGDPGCSCMSSRFGMDEYDRLFVPDVFRFSVGVVDTAGNEITRIGAYGNVDSAGPGSLLPEPAIPLAAPNAVAAGNGKVYVADRKNRRIVVMNLQFASEAACAIP